MTDETEQTWPKTIKYYLHAGKRITTTKARNLGLRAKPWTTSCTAAMNLK